MKYVLLHPNSNHNLWFPVLTCRRKQVARILKPNSLFLYITYRQPHFVKPAIARPDVWSLEVENIEDPTGGGGFEYFGYVMRKFGG